jgi:TonB family protein
MNAALLYRSRGRNLIWMAFGCAIVIHLTAIVLAENRPRFVAPGFPVGDELIGIIESEPQPPPPEPETVSLPEQVPSVTDDAFPQEQATPPPIRPRRKIIVPVRPLAIGAGRTMQPGLVKALTLYAPHPVYPYEARRERITGSGIAELIVDPVAGSVTDARMAQSTGSVILDKATLDAFRRWRFKPGAAPNVRVPITYTLTGVSY